MDTTDTVQKRYVGHFTDKTLTYQLDALLFFVEHNVLHFKIPATQKFLHMLSVKKTKPTNKMFFTNYAYR